jgi:acyl-homoserine lactone acylase PvdQ
VKKFWISQTRPRKLWLALAVGFALAMVSAFAIKVNISKDLEKIEVRENGLQFSAERDASGVWNIDAADPDSLWFAFGYVQSLDREFQLELFRQIALGKLSEWIGESQLARDRMMRMASKLGQWEWENPATDSLVPRAAKKFVEGRLKFLKDRPTPEPIEYRLLKLSRDSQPEWEPWHILALIRFHSWEFSFDLGSEARFAEFREIFGKEYAQFLMPMEESQSRAMYEQSTVSEGILPSLPTQKRMKFAEIFQPPAQSAFLKMNSSSSNSKIFLPNFSNLSAEDFFSHGAGNGASNGWLAADSNFKLSPTLCNDTHLGFSWPSPLYPVRYSIRSSGASGQGFMLPGLPVVVIGLANNPANKQSLTWGITMASFGDTQDLIEISQKTASESKKVDEIFYVRDSKGGQREVLAQEEWTSFGPRIDQFYKFGPKPIATPLALDWMGFHKVPSITDFFLRRNLLAQSNLLDDFASRWTYPAVNLFWIERENGKTKMGHHMTGMLFARKDRREQPMVISEKQAEQRTVSQPAERPFFRKVYQEGERTFLVTGNQKVFKEPLAFEIASDWVESSRTEQILDGVETTMNKPEASQTDYVSRSLLQFLKAHLDLLTDDVLCPPQSDENCLEYLKGLRSFEGKTDANDWRTLLAFKWYVKVKQNLWPAEQGTQSKDHEDLFSAWVRATHSARLINHLSANQSYRKKWESITNGLYPQMVAQSFHESLSALRTGYPDLRKAKWGDHHVIAWQHPFALAPEPAGPILSNYLLGHEKVSGGVDSPGRFDFGWRPSKPLEFPASHGSATRLCVEVPPDTEQPLKGRWSIPTGVSGNPFSKWATVMPREYFFKEKLFDPSE